jgi:hypothetical protein
VGYTIDLDDIERRKLLPVQVLELRPNDFIFTCKKGSYCLLVIHLKQNFMKKMNTVFEDFSWCCS